MPGMITTLAAALHKGRSTARDAARDDLAPHVHEDAVEAGNTDSDAPRAYAAAAGLVSAWGATALYKVGAWNGKRPLAAEIQDTTALMDPRLARAAATEATHAFNETRGHVMVAHADVLEGLPAAPPRPMLPELPTALAAREGQGRRLSVVPPAPPPQGPYRGLSPVPPPGLRPIKVWSAMLDGRVCKQCRDMHGTAVPVRDEFPGGDPPRHPFCRCIPIFIMTSATIEEIERAYEDLAA